MFPGNYNIPRGRLLSERRTDDEELVLQAASSDDMDSLLGRYLGTYKYEALQFAAQYGHARVVRHLLQNTEFVWCFTRSDGASDASKKRSSNYWFFFSEQGTSSPLHLAVKEGHREVVQELIEFLRHHKILSDPSVNVEQAREQDYANTKAKVAKAWFKELIEWAVRWGHSPVVDLLLTGPLLRVSSPPLHLAAHLNHLGVLKVLLKHCKAQLSELEESEPEFPAQLNIGEIQPLKPEFSPHSSIAGLTALHLGAQSGSVSTVQLLVSIRGTDVNARSKPEMFTPLHMAANFGNTEVVKFLLQGKSAPDLTARDRMGRTALHYAAAQGHEDVVQELLLHGKQLQIASIVDYDGLLALHMAARAGHANVIRVLRSYGGINSKAKHSLQLRLELEREYMMKAKKQDPVYYGKTWAFPRPRLINSLFLRTDSFTPLHFAARYGHEAAVEELLKEESFTPLHFAARYGHEAAVKEQASTSLEIIERNVDFSLKDSGGFLAYDWMEVQKKGETFLKCVPQRADCDIVKKASSINKIFTSKRSLQAFASDIDEENKAMEELQHAWQTGEDPPITMFIIQRLEDEEIGGGKMLWLHWAVHEHEMDLLKKLLRVLDGMFVNEKDAFEHTALDLALLKSNAIAVRELLLHPSIEVDASKAFSEAVSKGKFSVAKELLSQRPEIVSDEVKNKLKDLPSSLFRDEKVEEFLVVLVTESKGIVGASNLLRWMLPWAKKRGAKRLVDVILDQPELKRGLYEDRQVYLDCANAILVGAALIGGVAFQGWLQPPLGYGLQYGGEEYAQVQKGMVRMFWWTNNGAFFFAVGSLIVGAKGAVPMAEETDITRSVEKVKHAVAMASVMLGMALLCVVLAFTAAGFAVLPPVPSDMRIMRASVGWGGTLFGLALLWFWLSVWPLFLQTLGYFCVGVRRTAGLLLRFPCGFIMTRQVSNLIIVSDDNKLVYEKACKVNRRYKKIFLLHLVPTEVREASCNYWDLDWG